MLYFGSDVWMLYTASDVWMLFSVFTHVTFALTTVAICHVGAQTKPVQQRDHSEKVSVTMALCVVLVVEVEVTEIKELDFIEYLQWQPTKENLKKN